MDAFHRFAEAWQAVGATGDGLNAFEDLKLRYGASSRHYHTMEHIIAALDALQVSGVPLAHPVEADLALWYHDAVYDPVRPDNEELSTRLAARTLQKAGVNRDAIARIGAMILDTRHAAPATSPDGALVADADLATLGAADETFDAYDRAIRLEYAFVPDAAYRKARSELLARFLERPAIYQTEAFRRTHEQQARANLARAIHRLQTPGD